MKRKLRMGMVGGGLDAFIGTVHRIAVNMDGLAELVCGAFSIDQEVGRLSGEALFVAPDRVYATFEEMIEMESKIPEVVRMDLVTIVTPNIVIFASAYIGFEIG